MMDLQEILIEARTHAIKMAQNIAQEANERAPGNAGVFAGSCAALTMQNITVSTLLDVHAPGTKEGEEKIRAIYAAAADDAVERWHKSDLKERGFGPRSRG